MLVALVDVPGLNAGGLGEDDSTGESGLENVFLMGLGLFSKREASQMLSSSSEPNPLFDMIDKVMIMLLIVVSLRRSLLPRFYTGGESKII